MRDEWSHNIEKLKCICKTEWNNISKDLLCLKRVSETLLLIIDGNSEGLEAKEGGVFIINITEWMIAYYNLLFYLKR